MSTGGCSQEGPDGPRDFSQGWAYSSDGRNTCPDEQYSVCALEDSEGVGCIFVGQDRSVIYRFEEDGSGVELEIEQDGIA